MLNNDEGADFLPMRLITVLIIASLVLVSAVACAADFAGKLSKTAARDSASRIAAVAATEYAESCPGRGTGVSFDVSVPDSVSRLSFGPDKYYIQYADGSCETYLTGVPFRSGSPGPELGGPLVLYPGNYRIRVAVEDVEGRLTVLLYTEAK